MSIRKTKVISFNVSSGTFKNYNDAVKEANSIKIWLQRLCNKNRYSCKAIIGISQHDPQAGEVKLKKSGKGRLKATFVRTSFYRIKTSAKPHIHIVLYANPADMLATLLQKRMNKKYKSKVCWVNECEEYVEEAVDYAIRQSLKLRTLEVDADGILIDDTLGFYAAVEAANRRARGQRIAFTYSELKKSGKNPDDFKHSLQPRFSVVINCLHSRISKGPALGCLN